MIDIDKHFLYVSDFLDTTVVHGPSGRRVGRVRDVVVTNKNPYPEVSALFIKPSLFRQPLLTPWENIEPFETFNKKLVIKDPSLMTNRPLSENESAVRETFLDKQILDLDGAKVIRVNDLHFLREQHRVLLVHMDVGTRGFLRRLGWLKTIDAVSQWLFAMRLQPKLLSWKHVHALPSSSQEVVASPLKLNVAHQKLNLLHPADLSEILKDLSSYERVAIFRSLDAPSAAETLEELTPESQKPLIEAIDKTKIPGIIAKMSPDKAADMLAILSQRRRNEILRQLSPELREEMTRLTSHPERAAGSIMTTDFLTQPFTATVQQALDIVKQSASSTDAIYYLYVVDQETKLQGVVTLRRMLQSPPETLLTAIMNPKVRKVTENTSKEKAVKLFVKYKFGAVPVVDSHNKMKGVILFKDAISELLPQMEVELNG